MKPTKTKRQEHPAKFAKPPVKKYEAIDVVPAPRQTNPATDLDASVKRLRKAIKEWTHSDIAFSALSDMHEQKGPSPELELVVSKNKETVRVPFSFEQANEPDRIAMTDLFLGMTVSQYENALLEIVRSSQAAYAALQKQKDL
jgi:hypothetical protein